MQVVSEYFGQFYCSFLAAIRQKWHRLYRGNSSLSNELMLKIIFCLILFFCIAILFLGDNL